MLIEFWQKTSYYSSDEHIQGMLSEFLNYPIIPASGTFYMDDALSRLSEVFKKLENLGLIDDLSYGDGQMQWTKMGFFPNLSKLRLYKTALIKELQLKDSSFKSNNGELMRNGRLTYSLDNKEIKYNDNKAVPMNTTSDYGRFLILLMSNIDKRVSYTQICDAVGIDYKIEKADPETDPSIKRQIQQLKKDLTDRLRKTGMPQSILDDLIVARDGYKMNKID